MTRVEPKGRPKFIQKINCISGGRFWLWRKNKHASFATATRSYPITTRREPHCGGNITLGLVSAMTKSVPGPQSPTVRRRGSCSPKNTLSKFSLIIPAVPHYAKRINEIWQVMIGKEYTLGVSNASFFLFQVNTTHLK